MIKISTFKLTSFFFRRFNDVVVNKVLGTNLTRDKFYKERNKKKNENAHFNEKNEIKIIHQLKICVIHFTINVSGERFGLTSRFLSLLRADETTRVLVKNVVSKKNS
jgi:hypothetical protein